MPLRLLLTALLASITLLAQADAIDGTVAAPAGVTSTIGDTAVVLPVLPGYADPSSTPRRLMEVISNALPPSNRLLSVMLQADFLDRMKAGDRTTPLSRYLAVQTFTAQEWTGMDAKTFDDVKSVLREQNARLLKDVAPDVNATTDRLTEGLAKLSGDASLKVRTADPSSLGIFDDQPDSISLAALQTISATAHDKSMQVRQVMGLAAIRLHGKMLMVSVYSNYGSKDDIDWVEGQVSAWVSHLRELNP